jgi:hypothetical protein
MKKITYFLLLLVPFLAITVSAQSLISISPSTGAAGQSVSVTITGSGTSFGNFTQVALNLGTNIVTASDIEVVSPTEIAATLNIPSTVASGDYTLIANSGLDILQLPGAFTITGGNGTAPSIVSVSPNTGAKGQTLLVTITGANTSFNQSTSTIVTFLAAGVPIVATAVVPLSKTKLTCLLTIPANAAAGVHSLVMTTSNNGILMKAGTFTVTGSGGNNSPKITSVAPNTGARGQTLNVTITGSNTQFIQSSNTTVSLFNGGSPINANFAFATSNTSIAANFTIPSTATLGMADVEVTTSNQGTITLANGFTITQGNSGTPELVSVSPPFGSRGQTLDVTITGANTSFQQGSNTVGVYLFNQATGIAPNTINVISNTEIIANFTLPEDMDQGIYSVAAYSDFDGYLELPESFTVFSTGIIERDKTDLVLKVYPNPVHETLVFESVAEVKEVVLMDISGKQMQVPLDEINMPDEHTYSFSINRPGITPGIYFLRVHSDQGSVYQKIMVN